MHKYLPDPFVIAIVLTVFTVFLAMVVQGTGFMTAVQYWGDEFWDLLAFTMQITIILVAGYVIANTPVAEWLIHALVTRIHRPQTAVAVATLIRATTPRELTKRQAAYYGLTTTCIAGSQGLHDRIRTL